MQSRVPGIEFGETIEVLSTHTTKPAAAGMPFSVTMNEGLRTDEEANVSLNTCGKELATISESPLETVLMGGVMKANTRRKNNNV